MAPAALRAASVLLALCLQAQPALDRFAGHELSESERLEVASLLGPIPKSLGIAPPPWRVWRVKGTNAFRYAVLSMIGPVAIPGAAVGRVDLFSYSGARMAAWSFQLGNRLVPKQVNVKFSGELSANLLSIDASPAVNGRDVSKLFFAVSESGMSLARMEASKGRLVGNSFYGSHIEIGPPPVAATVEQWIELLYSQKPLDQVVALQFLLSTYQSPRPNPSPAETVTDGPYGETLESLRSDPSVRARIESLKHSSTSWVRQAASIAAAMAAPFAPVH